MAWDAFNAEEFPGDEALKLVLALGLDLEREVIGDKRLVTEKGARVATFKSCIQAIPRIKERGKFAFFDELVAPAEEELRVEPQQLRIAETAAAYGEAGDADEET